MIGGRHDVAVACLRLTRYNIHWVSGNEKKLPAPRFVPFVTGMTGVGVNMKLNGGDLEFNSQIEEQLLRHFDALTESGGSK